jgi:hypothetical protein
LHWQKAGQLLHYFVSGFQMKALKLNWERHWQLVMLLVVDR